MLSTGDARADTRAKAAKVTADKAEASCVRLARESPMVDVGQDLAARARFDPKAAERAKPGLGHRTNPLAGEFAAALAAA